MGLMDMVVLGIDRSFSGKACLMLLAIRIRMYVLLVYKGWVISPYAPLAIGVVWGMRVSLVDRDGYFWCY